MATKELRQKTPQELTAMAADIKAELRDLRTSVKTRQTRQVRTLRNKKRELARILTLIREAGTVNS
ncbi:MAG: 50S ribosomal protein L29 [Patescibacteria group bacterium]